MKHDPTAATPPDGFDDAFGAEVIDLIKEAFDLAYDDASEDYDPDGKGSDLFLFGSSIFTFARHQLIRLIEERGSELGMGVITKRPHFVFRVGRFRASFYRVGERASESIATSLPRNRRGAPNMVDPQLVLPGEEFEPKPRDVRDARNLIIAHHGNPDDGLQAVHACVGIRNEDESTVREWAFARAIWVADDCVVPAPPATPHVPEENVEEPVVRRRKADEDESDEQR
ncbi:MAG: hypothetical protein AB7S26_29085 [Sandaracinaceae bacterium]